jgi:hypothetical protein
LTAGCIFGKSRSSISEGNVHAMREVVGQAIH